MSNDFGRIKTAPAPLWLLVRVSALQTWRRILSLREQSRLLTAIIVLFIVGYLWLSFWLFYHGLKFLAAFPGLGVVLTERLLYLLFAFLFALLLLSNLVISYTNLFRNREAAFLSGIDVVRARRRAYFVAGILVGIGGVAIGLASQKILSAL